MTTLRNRRNGRDTGEVREDRLRTTPVATDDNRAIPGSAPRSPPGKQRHAGPTLQNTSRLSDGVAGPVRYKVHQAISGTTTQSVEALGIHHLACGTQHVY